MARTLILNDPVSYPPNEALTNNSVTDLIAASADFLSQSNAPALETLKMQVAFDEAYVQSEKKSQQEMSMRSQRAKALKSAIAGATSLSDLASINDLYRRVYQLLLLDQGQDSNEKAEKEIAAALESVFPKIGLKSFVSLSRDEKIGQMDELMSIVRGIRVFNREMGKGGAGIEPLPERLVSSLTSFIPALRREADDAKELCASYASSARLKSSKRLKEELANRRQYESYVVSVHDSAGEALAKAKKTRQQLESELSALKSLVGSRTSVPKEKVYPMFRAVSDAWEALEREEESVKTLLTLWETLNAVGSDFTLTLKSEDLVHDASTREGKEAADDDGGGDGDGDGEGKHAHDDESESEEKADDIGEEKTAQSLAAKLLLPEDTPDYLTLPLSYQGFCPVTVVRRAGLLLPGDPEHGIVAYGDAYVAFASAEARDAFLERPESFARSALRRARRSPELIHLLGLQSHFPHASIERMLRMPRAAAGEDDYLPGDAPAMVDASAETPLHFCEKRIDPAYEWNEWSMRRKAVQIANLRKAKTVSSQTTSSHFRRENETQVYLPKAQGTQTGISRGTNPPRHHRYIAGLRGQKESKVSVVNMVFDL